jgi:hypothetical protein
MVKFSSHMHMLIIKNSDKKKTNPWLGLQKIHPPQDVGFLETIALVRAGGHLFSF